jgi:tetratricopeptide (TPR) repeat protein
MTKTVHLLLGLVLAGATFFVYRGVLNNELVWDSHNYVLNNPFILELSRGNLKWMLTTQFNSNWHPVTWFSYAIDTAVYGGISPSGLHLTNLMLHGLNTLLFYTLALRLFALYNGEHTTGLRNWRVGAAFIAALLFAVHPQHVESVAWVAERKDTLFLAFTLLTFIFYLEFASRASNQKTFYVFSLIWFTLAVGSKSMPVTVPALLLILDVFPLRRLPEFSPRKVIHLVLEKVPFALISVAVSWLTLAAQRPDQAPLAALSLGTRVLVAFDSALRYIQKFLAPLHLSPLYPHPGELEVSTQTLIPIGFIVAATLIFAILWARGQRFWLAGWVFYLLSLVPVAGLIQVGIQAMADRYAYLPTLPFYLWIGGGFSTLFFLGKKDRTAKRVLAPLGLLGICAMLMTLTVRQVGVWQTPLSLFGYVVRSYPDNGVARQNLAVEYFNLQAYDRAIEHFARAAELGEVHAKTTPAFALSYLRIGRYPEALNIYRQLLDSEVDSGVSSDCIWYNAGWTFARLGDQRQSMFALAHVDRRSAQGASAATLMASMQESVATDITFPELCADYPSLSAENHASRASQDRHD